MRQHQVTPPQHRSSFQQSSRPTPGLVGSRSQSPKRGCWTCGGPHYKRDCPQKTDCKDKILHFTDEDYQRKSLRGKNRGVSLRFISSMKLMKFRRKGCQMFSVVALNDKGDSKHLDKHPFLVEFKDVFPEELPGLPPKREIDFTIGLKLGTKHITKAPYRMSALELKELQIQLKELLELGFIRPSISP
eukprot:PITA_33352